MGMSKSKTKKTVEFTSLTQWLDNYKITKERDKEFEKLTEDPEKFGSALANSTIDRLLKKRHLANS